MKAEILNLLRGIEEKHSIQIVYACEVGSRAWGLEHRNSDYDVRFIFIYPIETYLSLDEPLDVIDVQSKEIDCHGWDIKKTLKLFRKHNPTLLEWLHSPVVYQDSYEISKVLRSLNESNFQIKPVLYHYVNMAKKNLEDLTKRNDSKQLINIFRPILICKWILTRNEFPPLQLKELIEPIHEQEVKITMYHIIDIKKKTLEESSLQQLEFNHLQKWMTEELRFIEESVSKLQEHSAMKVNMTREVNKVFRSFVLKSQ
ncbi:DNA polymerase beta superfamily protein [Bacillus salitolerans]|uniref:DNA polymerase beta superfamily protein n=1 Tax=Bacillus salitolerans TaxID=1437434 RepID=A0ABW4LQ83_9BACI